MAAQTDCYKCPNCEFSSEDFNLVVNHVQACDVSDESADHSLPNLQQGTVEIYEHGSEETAGAMETGSRTPTPQSEHGWSHAATLLLIEALRLRKHWFEDSTKKKYEVWRDIAKELQSKGHNIGGSACDQKMRTLKKRYKIIKENASLSGRGALKQWQYFDVMDELMRGDPAIVPTAVEATFSTPSTSTGIMHQPHQQASTSVIPARTPSPSMSPVPSPARSPVDWSPAMSPAESSGDLAMRPPSENRPRKRRAVVSEASDKVKFLENIAASSQERSVAVHDFLDTLKVQQEARNEQVKELQNTVRSLQERLLHLQEQRVAEYREMQQQHQQELKDLRQQHQQELGNLRQQHQQELGNLRQEHKQELKDLQERFWQMQKQQQDQLLQVMLQRGQNT